MFMQEEIKARLRQLLIGTRAQLQRDPGRYKALLEQLDALESSLEGPDIDSALLRSILGAFPLELGPTRGVMPSDEGKKNARLLWRELNRIVNSRPEQDQYQKKDSRETNPGNEDV
jgi:hypothetical protein